MTARFEVSGWHAFGEEDSYTDGCQLEGGWETGGDERFSAETVPALVAKLCDFAGVTMAEVMADADICLDACDEIGRFDIQTMQDEHGLPASELQVDAWKQGQCRLWLATYHFRIERVERVPVNLQKAFAAVTP